MSLKDSSENVGRMGHETIGAEFLRSLGFSDIVCQLVASHVPAKRYVMTAHLGVRESCQ
jgi:predicted HD phosphohydrolase